PRPVATDPSVSPRSSKLLPICPAPVSSAAQPFNVASRASGFVAGEPSRQQLQYFTASGYVNDTWRVRRNLSLNAGLRYEYISVPTEKRGLLLLPVGGLTALRDPNATIDFAGSG